MGRKARVTFEYEPEQLDELRLNVGDIIEDVEDEDDGWCKGSLNGKVGLFPNNFVEFIEETTDSPVVNDQPTEVSKDSLAGKKAKVCFSYDAENADELTLNEGEIVEVIRQVEDGWWEGKVNGKTGVFPSNFVELVKGAEATPPPLPEKDTTPTEPESPSKPNLLLDEEDTANKRSSIIGQTRMMGGGMGFGNLINADILSGTRLKKVDAKKRVTPPEQKAPVAEPSPIKQGGSMKRKAPPVPPPASSSAPELPAKKPVGKAKVLFEYVPENEDELALSVGEIVTVLNKEVYQTDGWWEGELNGKVGLFPDNFVELLPDEPPKAAHSKPRTKSVPPAPVQLEKKPPPPFSTNEAKPSPETPKKDMKKLPEPPKKLSQPKEHDSEVAKPVLPPKKPVPPKPSTKPSVLPKKPVPKPPSKPHRKEKEIEKSESGKDKLNKTAPGLMEGIFKNDDSSGNEACSFDAVKKHEMLDHLTKDRPRLQNQRPPSTTRISAEGNLFDLNLRQEPEGEKEDKLAKTQPIEPAWKREARELREAAEKPVPPAPVAKEKKVHIVDKKEEKTKKSPPILRKSTEEITKETDSASADEIKSLKQQVSDLQALVEQMKVQMDEMQQKHEEDLKRIEKRVQKDIEILTEDFDEQRRKCAKLEIDFDRLKKRRRRDSEEDN